MSMSAIHRSWEAMCPVTHMHHPSLELGHRRRLADCIRKQDISVKQNVMVSCTWAAASAKRTSL